MSAHMHAPMAERLGYGCGVFLSVLRVQGTACDSSRIEGSHGFILDRFGGGLRLQCLGV